MSFAQEISILAYCALRRLIEPGDDEKNENRAGKSSRACNFWSLLVIRNFNTCRYVMCD